MTADVDTPWRPPSPLDGELTRLAAITAKLEGELTAVHDRITERLLPFRRDAVDEVFDELIADVSGRLHTFTKILQLLPEHRDAISDD